MNLVGPKIKHIRTSQNITQAQLAGRCNVHSWDISRGTLAKIESQVRRVTDLEAALIAKVLKVDIAELFM